MKHKGTFLFLCFLILSVLVPEQVWSVGAGITYFGRLIDPTGQPVVGASVQFRIQVRTPGSENCLMYEEVQVKDLSHSAGVFSVTINDGSGTRLDSSGFTLDRVFANRGSFNFSAGACTGGTAYNPNASDGRRIQVLFNDGTFAAGTWEPMPSVPINFVPMAIESMQIGGYKKEQLIRVDDSVDTTNTELNAASWAKLLALLAGSSTQYVSPSSANFTAAPTWSGTPSASSDLVNKSYVDAAVAGSLPNVGTPGTYAKVTTDAKGRVTAGASLQESDIPSLVTAGKVSGSAISSGTIGGNTAINTTGNVVSSGTIQGAIVGSSSTRIFSGANYVELKAPAGLASILTITLPDALPAGNGYILASDTSGNLSWISPATGSVTAVGASAPLSATGGANPTLSISQANATTNGYLSSADWTAFNNKLDSSSAFSGDISGTLSTVSVDKIKGKAVVPAAYAAGQVLKFDGTNWINSAMGFAELTGKPTTLAGFGITDAQSSSLNSGNIFVGNASNVATAVAVSGDATLSNTGALTISNGSISTTKLFANPGINRIVATDASTGATLAPLVCSLTQVLNWTSNGWDCINPTGLTPLTTKGDLLVSNGVSNQRLPVGTDSYVLTADSAQPNGVKWAAVASSQWTTSGSNISYTSGNVGVGVASPSTKLDVGGTIATLGTGGMVIDVPNGATQNIQFRNRSGGWDAGFITVTKVAGTNADGTMLLKTGNGGNQLFLDSAGNVGVGTNSPGSKLDVKGTLRLSGSTSGYVGLAPAAAAGSTTYTLPSSDGTSGQFLKTDGAGALSWGTALSNGSSFSAANGVWNAPSISFANSSTSGFYSPAANDMVWTYSSDSRFIRFNGSGLTVNTTFVLGNGTVGGGKAYSLEMTRTGNTMLYPTSGYLQLGPSSGSTSLYVGSNIGISNASPGYPLDVTGDINSSTSLRIAGTQICTSSGCTATSDGRLKENITPLAGALENILKLQGVEYDWINRKKYGEQHQIGLIAQDLEKVYPEVVMTDPKTGFKSVAYDHLVAPLIEAVKELDQKMTRLERGVASEGPAVVGHSELEDLRLRVEKAEQENAALKSYLCGKDPEAPVCR